MFTNHSFDIYLYKNDFILNNLQRLICHKTHPTQNKHCYQCDKRDFILSSYLKTARTSISDEAEKTLKWHRPSLKKWTVHRKISEESGVLWSVRGDVITSYKMDSVNRVKILDETVCISIVLSSPPSYKWMVFNQFLFKNLFGSNKSQRHAT